MADKMPDWTETTCGCDAPRFTPAPRCVQCGKTSHRVDDPYKIQQFRLFSVDWFLDRAARLEARRSRKEMPRFEGRIVSDG